MEEMCSAEVHEVLEAYFWSQSALVAVFSLGLDASIQAFE